MKQKKIFIGLSAVGIIVIIGAAVVYFQLARPYVILWQSYNACQRLANPDNTHTYRSVAGVVKVKITPPKKSDAQRLSARLAWLKPATLQFNVQTSKGKINGVFRKNLWFYLPAEKTVFLARAGLPLWRGEGGNSPPVSVKQTLAVAATSPRRESTAMKGPPATRPLRASISPFTIWWETKAVVQGVQTTGGVPCYVVALQTRGKLRKKIKATARLWISQKDHLPRKVEIEFVKKDGLYHISATIDNLELNPNLKKSDFVFLPPAGTKNRVIPLQQVKRFFQTLPHFLKDVGWAANGYK